MTVEVIDFSDALKRAEEFNKKHVLLGNGFSIACEPKIFNYGSLLENAKPYMSEELLAAFELIGTTDFEAVIRALQNSAEILPIYGAGLSPVASRIAADAQLLKTALIRAISGHHPERPNNISEEKYSHCRKFLENFIGKGRSGKVYTLNYDLLLYWTLMHEPMFPDGVDITHDDGFRKDPDDYEADYVIWHGETHANSQNIHYVHGAMHLYDAGSELQKYTWVNTGEALVDQANEALSKDLYPIFVAEGESRQKLSKIKHSAYLHHNYKSFCSMCASGSKSSLFIFGHSLGDNDRHIFERAGRSKLSHLFISLFGDPRSQENMKIQRNAEKYASMRSDGLNSLGITYFDAQSAQVWG